MRTPNALIGSSLLVALIGVGASPACAQDRAASSVIDGAVSDTNLVSLADASVSILGSRLQVVTGANGRFRINALKAGQYILVVHHIGYVPSSTVLQVGEGDTLRMAFTLRQIATALDTVVVAEKSYSSRMGEFEDRRKFGFGHFLTRADIEKRNAVFFADLIRPVLSVAISEKMFTQVAMNMRYGCPFNVFLDGVQLPPPVNLNDLPQPNDVAGIEIYSGEATIPLQYKSMSTKGRLQTCGVMLVWTRDGS